MNYSHTGAIVYGRSATVFYRGEAEKYHFEKIPAATGDSENDARKSQYSPKPASVTSNVVPTEYVPVHIQNPGLLSQEVCLFEGATSVQVVPDAKRGGWMYSRPAFACHKVGGANSENNWYEYSHIMLPRNFHFIVASRIIGVFGGKGTPHFQSYRTGNDPFTVTYTSITPTRRQVSCGALVQLQRQPSSVQPLNIQVDLDLRPLGAAITDGVTRAVYGK